MNRLLLFISIIAHYAHAQAQSTGLAFNLGIGFTSTHGGTDIPVASLSLESKSWAINISSSGYHNNVMMQASYYWGIYWIKHIGSILGGQVSTGIGAGAIHSRRIFRPSEETQEVRDDLIPSINSRIYLYPNSLFFTGFESYHGFITDWIYRRMSTRDTFHFLVGIQI